MAGTSPRTIAPADNEMDAARTDRNLRDAKLRILDRTMADQRQSALAVKQACRMHLRSYETWSAGDAAMFLSITLEGLLLDKRQKDDLSARLQDSVAYWLGGSAANREKTKRRISELYKVRSNYVHNGQDAPADCEVDVVRELTREVIRKELLTLG